MSDPTRPWWTGDDDIGGIGFARFFAWTGMLMALASLFLAVAAPLEGDALRTVWITGTAAVSMWIAFMSVARYHALGMRASFAVPTAMVVGSLTILIMIYAFIVIWLASAGIVLPAPAHWLGTPPAPSPGITA
jgi:hypothetical protein